MSYPSRCEFCEKQDDLIRQTRSYRDSHIFSPEEIALAMDPDARSLDEVSDLVEEIRKLLK